MNIIFDRFAHVCILTIGAHIGGFAYVGTDEYGAHMFAVCTDNNPVEYIGHNDFHYAAHCAYKSVRYDLRYAIRR